jgi:hypothetical protein
VSKWKRLPCQTTEHSVEVQKQSSDNQYGNSAILISNTGSFNIILINIWDYVKQTALLLKTVGGNRNHNRMNSWRVFNCFSTNAVYIYGYTCWFHTPAPYTYKRFFPNPICSPPGLCNQSTTRNTKSSNDSNPSVNTVGGNHNHYGQKSWRVFISFSTNDVLTRLYMFAWLGSPAPYILNCLPSGLLHQWTGANSCKIRQNTKAMIPINRFMISHLICPNGWNSQW